MIICKDCRYFESEHYCHHPSNTTQNPVDGSFKMKERDCSVLNKGKCKNFEKLETKTVTKRFLFWSYKETFHTNLVRNGSVINEAGGWDTCDVEPV